MAADWWTVSPWTVPLLSFHLNESTSQQSSTDSESNQSGANRGDTLWVSSEFGHTLPCPAVPLRPPSPDESCTLLQDLGRGVELWMSFLSAAVDAVWDAGDRFGRLAEEHHLQALHQEQQADPLVLAGTETIDAHGDTRPLWSKLLSCELTGAPLSPHPDCRWLKKWTTRKESACFSLWQEPVGCRWEASTSS